MNTAPVSLRPRRDLAAMHARALRVGRRTRPLSRRQVRLWIPTTPLFLLLAPFALLLLPFLYLAPRAYLPRPAATLVGVGALLLSLSGTDIDVDTPDVRIRLRLV